MTGAGGIEAGRLELSREPVDPIKMGTAWGEDEKGNLTIKEATHPVEFTATESKNGGVLTYTADINFDRSLYDVRFGSGKFFSNLGDNAIVDEITLNVKLVVK